MQDLSVLVSVSDTALLISCSPRWRVLGSFGGRARSALLQGLHPSQGYQGLGQAEQSVSHLPHLYRARRLRTPLPLLKQFPLPAVPNAPPPF